MLNKISPVMVEHYVVLSSIIFIIGITGVLLGRRSIIHLLMSIELMLLSININFVAFSSFISDMLGQIFTIFILTVAASEAAIGLAIIVIYYRKNASIDIVGINDLKG